MMTPLTDYVSSNKWSISAEISQINRLFYLFKLDFFFFNQQKFVFLICVFRFKVRLYLVLM